MEKSYAEWHKAESTQFILTKSGNLLTVGPNPLRCERLLRIISYVLLLCKFVFEFCNKIVFDI
jgi:hypothetical protein